MEYLLDTITIIRHFTDIGKIGSQAKEILDSKENNSFVISVISLMEILYLSEKKRIRISLKETLKKIDSSSMYTVVDLTSDILKIAETVDFYEMHDRLILSTAKWLKIPVISGDSKFKEVNDIKVIWN